MLHPKNADIRDRLFNAVNKHTADYCDVRYETEEMNRIMYQGKEVQEAASTFTRGGIVRACYRGGWGYSVFNNLENLDSYVKTACENAKHAAREKTLLAEIPIIDAEYPVTMVNDFRTVSFDEKLKTLTQLNNEVLGFDEKIQSSNTGYSDSFRTVWFASSEGTWFMEERPNLVGFVVAIAGDGSLVQRAMESVRSTNDYSAFLSLKEKVSTVGQRSIDLLKAPSCEGGTFPVILNQRLAAVFIHEAFGHLSEADHLAENKKLMEILKVGRPMGPKNLSVVDDGTWASAAGTHMIDDEGTPTKKNYLIKNGVISGFLHSRETAKQMGMEPTGNARAINMGFHPIVRMRNTYIEGGSDNFDDMIKDIDDGYYACDMFGGMTAIEQFTFSSAYGYRIRNGKLGELVRDIVLTGNVFETLDNIDKIGNDFILTSSGGGCGKGGQAPLPCTFGSPHIRMQNVVTGGK